jgi:drug/metabolite transporter (DMT)-like permease
MLWIPITIAATGLQVARNALQRGLLAGAGPWGASLVRFLFGLPFSLLFLGVAWALAPHAHPRPTPGYFLSCAVGGAAQILATAAMLVSMRRSSFALGTVFQQSGIPLAALLGLAFGEHLGLFKWLGLALATGGLMWLGWPRERGRDWSAAGLGLLAGAGFAAAGNAFRQGALALGRVDPLLAAQLTVFVVQAMQSAALVAWLTLTDRRALRAAVTSWRASAPAGFFGAAASGLWFTAFALAPVGLVRAVGVTEMPIAAFAGRRMFAERLTPRQISAALITTLGVTLAALA